MKEMHLWIIDCSFGLCCDLNHQFVNESSYPELSAQAFSDFKYT